MLYIFCQNMLNPVEQVFISSLLATHNCMASLMHGLKKLLIKKELIKKVKNLSKLIKKVQKPTYQNSSMTYSVKI